MPGKLGIVHCRVCKREIDRNVEVEGKDWIMPTKNFFYCPKCYEDFGKKKESAKDDVHAEVDNDLWFAILYDYLFKELRISLDMKKVTSQWKNFLKKYRAKGMYFSMKYFYDVKKGDPKKTDGIGIIPYIYDEACTYWINREAEYNNVCARIEEQIVKREQQKKVVVKATQRIKKKTIDLSQIGEDEDDS